MSVILARGYDASSSPLSFLRIVIMKHILLVLIVDLKGAKVVFRAYFSGVQRIFHLLETRREVPPAARPCRHVRPNQNCPETLLMLCGLGIEIPQRIFAGASWQAPRINQTKVTDPGLKSEACTRPLVRMHILWDSFLLMVY
jgi:hypothetical protein